MLRLITIVGLLVLGCGLLVSPGLSGDKKDPPVKAKGTLPTYWKKLGLTDDQKQKVYTIRGNYAAKIGALKAQLEQLQKQEAAELRAILTNEQKTALERIYAEKAGGGKDTPKEKKPEPKDK
jgi:Spy/CpxP family protein refolding chaperone